MLSLFRGNLIKFAAIILSRLIIVINLLSCSTDGRPIDLSRYLGGIVRNSNNSIVGAQAVMAFWVLKSNEIFSKQTGFAVSCQQTISLFFSKIFIFHKFIDID